MVAYAQVDGGKPTNDPLMGTTSYRGPASVNQGSQKVEMLMFQSLDLQDKNIQLYVDRTGPSPSGVGQSLTIFKDRANATDTNDFMKQYNSYLESKGKERVNTKFYVKKGDQFIPVDFYGVFPPFETTAIEAKTKYLVSANGVNGSSGSIAIRKADKTLEYIRDNKGQFIPSSNKAVKGSELARNKVEFNPSIKLDGKTSTDPSLSVESLTLGQKQVKVSFTDKAQLPSINESSKKQEIRGSDLKGRKLEFTPLLKGDNASVSKNQDLNVESLDLKANKKVTFNDKVELVPQRAPAITAPSIFDFSSPSTASSTKVESQKEEGKKDPTIVAYENEIKKLKEQIKNKSEESSSENKGEKSNEVMALTKKLEQLEMSFEEAKDQNTREVAAAETVASSEPVAPAAPVVEPVAEPVVEPVAELADQNQSMTAVRPEVNLDSQVALIEDSKKKMEKAKEDLDELKEEIKQALKDKKANRIDEEMLGQEDAQDRLDEIFKRVNKAYEQLVMAYGSEDKIDFRIKSELEELKDAINKLKDKQVSKLLTLDEIDELLDENDKKIVCVKIPEKKAQDFTQTPGFQQIMSAMMWQQQSANQMLQALTQSQQQMMGALKDAVTGNKNSFDPFQSPGYLQAMQALGRAPGFGGGATAGNTINSYYGNGYNVYNGAQSPAYGSGYYNPNPGWGGNTNYLGMPDYMPYGAGRGVYPNTSYGMPGQYPMAVQDPTLLYQPTMGMGMGMNNGMGGMGMPMPMNMPPQGYPNPYSSGFPI